MKFDIILADPPWDFEVWNRETGNGRSAASHYSVMSLDAMCQLPVANIAANNCALVMWCVWPRIFDAQQIFEAWGFEYKTLAWEWIKLNRSGIGWHVGMGYYCRANPEPALLAIKGTMPVAVKNQRNLIVTYEDNAGNTLDGLPMAGFLGDITELPLVSPIGQHSQKPKEQYQKIEALYPNCNKIELFARKTASGWKAIGNEIDGKDIQMALREIANA